MCLRLPPQDKRPPTAQPPGPLTRIKSMLSRKSTSQSVPSPKSGIPPPSASGSSGNQSAKPTMARHPTAGAVMGAASQQTDGKDSEGGVTSAPGSRAATPIEQYESDDGFSHSSIDLDQQHK